MERVALAGRPRVRDHALGITWLLDGLEVTLVGAVANVLGKPELAVLAEGRSFEEIAALDDAITREGSAR